MYARAEDAFFVQCPLMFEVYMNVDEKCCSILYVDCLRMNAEYADCMVGRFNEQIVVESIEIGRTSWHIPSMPSLTPQTTGLIPRMRIVCSASRTGWIANSKV